LPIYFILRSNCDDTRAETRFRLSAKRTSPFKSAGASVQSNTGSRGVRISGSNAGYTMYQGTAVAQWLRYWATNRKVAGSIPDGVIGIFH
jgi:hypothetical protein